MTAAHNGLRWLAEELADESKAQERSASPLLTMEGDHTAVLVELALEASRLAFDLARGRFEAEGNKGDL